MARIIVYDGREHPDPDAAATIEQVRDIMATWYPDMANATYKTEKRGSDTLYVFRKTVGTKGCTQAAALAEIIVQTPPARLDLLDIYANAADDTGRLDTKRLAELYTNDEGEEELEQALAQANRYTTSVASLNNALTRRLR